MNKLHYCALMVLATVPFCQGTPTTRSRAYHTSMGVLKSALSIGSACFIYKAAQTFDFKYISRDMTSLAKGIYNSGELKRDGLHTVAAINLMGCSFYVFCKAGASAYESFKEACTSKNIEVKEKTSLENREISETTL